MKYLQESKCDAVGVQDALWGSLRQELKCQTKARLWMFLEALWAFPCSVPSIPCAKCKGGWTMGLKVFPGALDFVEMPF